MSILDEIVKHKRTEVASRKKQLPCSELQGMVHFRRKPVSLKGSLLKSRPFGIIAEVKRSSPSAGAIKAMADPATIAVEYQGNGAAAISVLTDSKYFNGSVDDLASVRAATSLPVLRKEFIIDHYQVEEARAYGADAILLIAGILERSQLAELAAHARALGMETLVEIYDPSETGKLDYTYMTLIGVNNRDLRTMTVNINHTIEVAATLPPTTTIVSESGITSPSHLHTLLKHNIHSALIGEYFMKSGSPGSTLASLLAGVQA